MEMQGTHQRAYEETFYHRIVKNREMTVSDELVSDTKDDKTKTKQ